MTVRPQFCYFCGEVVQIDGQPNICPRCGPQWLTYRPSLCADAALIHRECDRDMILLIRRKNNPGAGEWSMPGGHVEPLEFPEDAAARELREETGITNKLHRVGRVGEYIDPVPNDPRVVVVYAFVVYGEVSVELDDSEADNYCWADAPIGMSGWKRQAFKDAWRFARSRNKLAVRL